MTKYDVFISCKSEDYEYSEDIYNYLTENCINAFLASKELRKLGDSEYRERIEDALEQAEHLIVVASSADYIKSKWVKYEWGLFINAMLDDTKSGNIITILKDVKPKEIAFALRKYESLKYESYKNKLLGYVDTENAKQRRKEKEEIQKIKEEKLRKENAEKEKVKALKSQILGCVEEFAKQRATLGVDVSKIKSLVRSLGVEQSTCPVCGSIVKLEESFCPNCGWQYSWVSALEGVGYLSLYDKDLLSFMRCHHNDVKAAEATIEMLKSQYDSLLVSQSEEKTKFEECKRGLEKELDWKTLENQENREKSNAKIQELTALNKKLESEYRVLDKRLCEAVEMRDRTIKEKEVLIERINDLLKVSQAGYKNNRISPKWSKDITPQQKKAIKSIIGKMVYVVGGRMELGATMEQSATADRDEKPSHTAEISDFWICNVPVTNSEWDDIIGRNESKRKGNSFPVVNVSLWDCRYFINRINLLSGLNFSLPTEAQWEFAARGGMKSKGYIYSGSNVLEEVGIINTSKIGSVGTLKPNELGIFDMSGNISEWCDELKGRYTSDAVKNPRNYYKPSFFDIGYILKGGDFQSPGNCRVSYRAAQNDTYKSDKLGFRLILNP